MTFLIKKPGTAGWHRDPRGLYARSLFPAEEKQLQRLLERKSAENVLQVHLEDMEFEVFRGVYQTSTDTELMVRALSLRSDDTFLEIGCGCGAVSLVASRQCAYGVGVDINPLAVRNAIHNRARLAIHNVDFLVADVFEGVKGKYDVLICNPPYNEHATEDAIDGMFWDPNNAMKTRFFNRAREFIYANGRLYFGWANFADLDIGFPLRTAERAGFKYVRHYAATSSSGVQQFFVIEFRGN